MGKRFFFICPDDPVPRGGILVIYRHAALLREMGFDAYILHSKPDFKCDWFSLEMPRIVYPQYSFKEKAQLFFHNFKNVVRKVLFRGETPYPVRLKLGQPLIFEGKVLEPVNEQDCLILPEYNVTFLHNIFPIIPFIIFNQNAYYTFEYKPLPKTPFSLSEPLLKNSPYLSPFLKKVIVVSEDSLNYVKTVFPAAPVERIHLSIDYELFNDEQPKSLAMTFMPRKASGDSAQVFYILSERGKLKNWKVIPLDNMKLEEVAGHIKTSALFLSFADSEGFSLPIIEAIASGAVVVGYHGEGGREIIQNSVEKGNIIEYVKKVEELALKIEANREGISKKEAKRIREEFPLSQEKEDLMRIYSSL